MSDTKPIEVLVCAPNLGDDLEPLRRVSPRVRIVDGSEPFARYRRAVLGGAPGSRQALDDLKALLANAEVLCMAYPVPPKLRDHAPALRWLHHTQAGVSNLWQTDLWSDERLVITSSRGHVDATAIAEYAIAGFMAFARGVHGAFLDKAAGALDVRHYDPVRIDGAMLGIVGLGGIGREVSRLGRALGMRVVGTRRSIADRTDAVDYADVVYPAAELTTMAADCDFIAVCTQLTPETTGLIDAGFFSALKRRPVLANVSRGEVVDEPALLAALESGAVRGALLDVYAGELDGNPPRPEWLARPDVLLTPHIAGRGGIDLRTLELFCENLRRYVAAEPLLNRVDRERGY